jgi:Outer membrane lipoprotein-sorting protein
MISRFAWAVMSLLAAIGVTAAATNNLSDAQIQGRQLAQQLCEARPAESITNTGVLEIRDGKGNRTNYPVKCEVMVGPTNWWCIYDATQKRKPDQPIFVYTLSVTHSEHEQNNYIAFVDCGLGTAISNCETMFPFRHSDFWIADLGLEFFHWPEQRILKHEMRRGRACKVLESTNPNPTTNGYSRVVSWIDNESGGIVQAEAYDFKNKLLKEFAPKSFKKVNGQWELQEMEIRNDQTGSRTRLEFDDFSATNSPDATPELLKK